MKHLICYCYEYTEADIINDFLEHNGKSTILAKIAKAKKTNICQCDIYHPEKR